MKEIFAFSIPVAVFTIPFCAVLVVVVFAAKIADIGLMRGASWLWVGAPMLIPVGIFAALAALLCCIYAALFAFDRVTGRL